VAVITSVLCVVDNVWFAIKMLQLHPCCSRWNE